MNKCVFIILAVCATVATAPVYAQKQISENVTTTYQFGDWRVVCEKQNKAKESCVMLQSIVEQTSGREVIQANFAKHKDGYLMTLKFPIGIYLPPGAGLEIVDHKKLVYPFTFCQTSGCFVNEVVNDEVMNLLRKKEAATITFAPNNQGGVTLPFSLKGFFDAAKKL